MIRESHILIGRGHTRYSDGRRLERAGKIATNVGLGVGALHVGASLIAGRGKDTRRFAGRHLAGRLAAETFIPLPKRLSNYLSSTRAAGALRRGTEAAGARLGSYRTLRRGAMRVALLGRRLGVPKWAPRAILYGGGAAAAGSVLKMVGGSMIRRGHELHAQGR